MPAAPDVSAVFRPESADEIGFDVGPREVRGQERLAQRMRALRDEFEERRTPEAELAKATDRLQSLLLHWTARGGTRPTPGVTADDARTRRTVIGEASASPGRAG